MSAIVRSKDQARARRLANACIAAIVVLEIASIVPERWGGLWGGDVQDDLMFRGISLVAGSPC